MFALSDDPAVGLDGKSIKGNGDSAISRARREVDQWGIAVEMNRQLNSGIMRGQAPISFAFGLHIRGIDQGLDGQLIDTGGFVTTITYAEDLDTRYYGGPLETHHVLPGDLRLH